MGVGGRLGSDAVVDVVRGLTVVQRYPYADVAPSADLVLWSRLGSRYEPDDLQRALEVLQLFFFTRSCDSHD